MATDQTKRQETAVQGVGRQLGQRGVDADADRSDGIGVFARAHNVPYEQVAAHIHATATAWGLDPSQALAIARAYGMEAFDQWLASQGVPAEHRIGGLTVTAAGRGDAPAPTAQDRRHALARKLVADRPKDAAMIDAMLGGRR